MRAIKLKLVKDERFPGLMRLSYSKDEVPLSDVLLSGIHPWDYGSRLDDLCHQLLELLNSESFQVPVLKEFGYCPAFASLHENEYWRDGNIFERLMGSIESGIFFVDRLSYLELVEIAKDTLRRDWTNDRVYSIISKIHHDFGAIRDFIKSKDKRITLSGYSDINKYDLSRIFSLSDFEGEDKILIEEALPATNFRSVAFLKSITDERGYLRLVPTLDFFQMRFGSPYDNGHNQMVLFNCHRKDVRIKFYPSMSNYPAIRNQAKKVAAELGEDSGRYCFSVDIEKAEEIVTDQRFQISFQDLRYHSQTESHSSYAQLAESAVRRFAIGRFVGAGASGETMRDILRKYEVSMTGRKEELLDKLAVLAARVYRDHVRELDQYFAENLFIRTDGSCARQTASFPVLEGLDLRNMILSMYAVKHLRGNVILDASHDNDAFDLKSLARALLRGEVTVEGTFVEVARN